MVFAKGLPFCNIKLSPVVLGLSVAIQVLVDAILLVNGILTLSPLQIEAVVGLVIDGAGRTVTVIV